MFRKLGKSNIVVSALGMGCWPIGGQWGEPDGRKYMWNEVNDEESLRAIQTALDNGINFFDTADCYGLGHSEELLGKALKGKRDKVVIATKFGHCFIEGKCFTGETNASPEYIRGAVENSLRRLNTDYIDLYLLHIWEYPPEKVDPILETLEKLVEEGKIRGYGWSTDVYKGVEAFNKGKHNIATEVMLNIFEGSIHIVKFAEQNNLGVLCRTPLAMGLLSGRYTTENTLPSNDVRSSNQEWIVWFKDGKPNPDYLKRLEAVREILTRDGRTLVQGALAWIWAKSEVTIPIPGMKNSKQVEENAKAMSFGPLSKEDMEEIEKLIPFRYIEC